MSILNKVIKLKRKEHKIKARLLFPPGSKAYILKRDGTTKPFTILAIFEAFGVSFDKFRGSTFFEFAALQDEEFTPFATSRKMRSIAQVATHIAVTTGDGDSVIYSVRTGDEWQPFYFDWTYTLYAKQESQRFGPAENADE